MKKICCFFLIMIFILSSTGCHETWDPIDARRTVEYMESYKDPEQLIVIHVKRISSLWNFTRPMVIYVNGRKFAGVDNGEDVIFFVPTGRHTIQARFSLFQRSNRITFRSDIANGFSFETNYFIRFRLRMVNRVVNP